MYFTFRSKSFSTLPAAKHNFTITRARIKVFSVNYSRQSGDHNFSRHRPGQPLEFSAQRSALRVKFCSSRALFPPENAHESRINIAKLIRASHLSKTRENTLKFEEFRESSSGQHLSPPAPTPRSYYPNPPEKKPRPFDKEPWESKIRSSPLIYI